MKSSAFSISKRPVSALCSAFGISKRPVLAICAAFLSFVTASAIDQDKDSLIEMKSVEIGHTYKSVSMKRASVHDPSIVVARDAAGIKKYYVFGSHLATASSSDLKNWNSLYWEGNSRGMFGTVDAAGRVTALPSHDGAYSRNQTRRVKVLRDGEVVEVDFGNYDAALWSGSSRSEGSTSVSGNQWAPDVIWNDALQKWCLYMSLNGDRWRSVIVLLTSDKIEGPYVYQGPVVYSGFQWTDIAEASWKKTDMPLVLPNEKTCPGRYLVGADWGRRWPNDIDPCVFYDEEGELWMTYGSWSGGIFILRLDKETGLRDYTYTYPGTNNNSDAVTSDPYFGKKIAGGYYVSGEASYVEHIGDYYYLFITNGGLEAAGGYEMHYFRSKRPDGPYTDASGVSAIYDRYLMNYGPSAGTTRGMKILGAYQWENMAHAELSQGHNSVVLDDDGRAYLVYHTRFNNGSEGHEVRVHQLFLNANGWLVAAPFEFMDSPFTADQPAREALCTKNDIIGTYRFIIHPYKMDYKNKAFIAPITITLKSNGLVSGDYAGSWKLKNGTSLITLRIHPKGTSTYTEYYGVVLPQTVSGTNMPSICFSAISSEGVSVWGCNVDGNYAVDYSCGKGITLPVTARQLLYSDVDLSPKELSYGARLVWTSSEPLLISDNGQLQVPTSTSGDTTLIVRLNYAVTKDNYAYTRSRDVRLRMFKTDLPENLNNAIATIQRDDATSPDNGNQTKRGSSPTSKNTYYDLLGRPVNNPTRGIYIRDGKKIVF